MKILLVDDNPYILKGLRQGIDYSALGITHIETARNMQEAVECLSKQDIPIVLTDIEMPNGTGLQLLEWIHDHKPDTVTMFCTNYADFDYARKAVELHSYDYYLKPIQYDELQVILQGAVEEARRRQAARENEKYGRYWIDNLKIQKSHYWEEILLRMDGYSQDELKLLAKDYHLSYDEESLFAIGLLRFSKEKSRMEGFSENLERFVMDNMVTELAENTSMNFECIIKCREDTWIIVLQYQNLIEKKYLEVIMKRIAGEMEQVIRCSINIYYLYLCRLSDAKSGYGRLEEAYSDHIHGRGRIIDIEEYQKPVVEYELDELTEWELMYRKKEIDKLLSVIRAYLENMAGQLNRQTMRGIQISVTQMVYTVLWEKKIDAGKLFHESYYNDIWERATVSVENLLTYLGCIFAQSIEYMEYSQKTNNVIDRVRLYIDEHFSENITCESIGEIVYLSSGYLTKLFKQETGKTLGNYIIDRRIEKAKAMLLSGEASVSEVASVVGYDNFSYFSRLFKSRVGISPKEFKDNIS